jgi:hypothetical protein
MRLDSQSFLLNFGKRSTSENCKVEQFIEFVSIEGNPFGRALNLNELSAAGDNHIHVGLGANVFGIGKV